MAIRKCSECNHWNEGFDYCEKCQAPLSAEAWAEVHKKRYEQEEMEKPKDNLDRWVDKVKGHRYWLVRITFQFFYSIWAIFMAILGFFVWLTVGMNG